MTDLNINKGFESMLPKDKTKEKETIFKNQIKFKIFRKTISFSLEVN